MAHRSHEFHAARNLSVGSGTAICGVWLAPASGPLRYPVFLRNPNSGIATGALADPHCMGKTLMAFLGPC